MKGGEERGGGSEGRKIRREEGKRKRRVGKKKGGGSGLKRKEYKPKAQAICENLRANRRRLKLGVKGAQWPRGITIRVTATQRFGRRTKKKNAFAIVERSRLERSLADGKLQKRALLVAAW